MLERFKLPIVIVVIVLLNQAVSYAVQAAVPNAYLTSGTTRYAVAQASTTITTTSTTLVDTGLSKAISIPAGKTGDVIVLFCADVISPSFAYAQAMVGTLAAPPGLVPLRAGGGTGGESQCANFYVLGVGAGSKTVKMQWRGYDNQQQMMFHRTMIVIVNIH